MKSMKKVLLLTLLTLSASAFAKEVHPKPISTSEVPGSPIISSTPSTNVTAATQQPTRVMTTDEIDANLTNMLQKLAQRNLLDAKYVPSGNSNFVADKPFKRDGRIFYIAKDMSEMATLPGFSMSAPSGFAGAWGVAFLGLGGSHGIDSNTNDGSASVGLGWGDGNKYVGGSFVLGLGSVNPADGGAFNRGNFSFSLGHNFTKYETGISVGVTGVDLWRASHDTDTDPSVYLAASKFFNTDWKPMFLTAGVGNNVFSSITNSDIGHCTDKWDGFVSGAIYLHPQLSLIADYTSGMLSAGFGIVPMPQYPVNLSIGAADLNKQNSEKEISIIGSLSVAYTF